MLNLNGPNGRNLLEGSTNFAFTADATAAPEPSSLSMIAAVALIGVGCIQRRRRRLVQS
jgi:hypothetical protein